MEELIDGRVGKLMIDRWRMDRMVMKSVDGLVNGC